MQNQSTGMLVAGSVFGIFILLGMVRLLKNSETSTPNVSVTLPTPTPQTFSLPALPPLPTPINTTPHTNSANNYYFFGETGAAVAFFRWLLNRARRR